MCFAQVTWSGEAAGGQPSRKAAGPPRRAPWDGVRVAGQGPAAGWRPRGLGQERTSVLEGLRLRPSPGWCWTCHCGGGEGPSRLASPLPVRPGLPPAPRSRGQGRGEAQGCVRAACGAGGKAPAAALVISGRRSRFPARRSMLRAVPSTCRVQSRPVFSRFGM